MPVSYKVVDQPWYAHNPQDLETELNSLGASGWDLQLALPHMAREQTRWVFNQGAGGASAPAGSMVLLGTASASNSPALQITNIPAGYDVYMLELINLVSTQDPSTTQGGDPCLRFSTNGGASYDAGPNYGWTLLGYGPNNSPGRYSNGSSAPFNGFIAVSGAGTLTTASAGGFSGNIRMYNLASSSVVKNTVSQGMTADPSNSYLQRLDGVGFYNQLLPVNALQVTMNNTWGSSVNTDTIVSGKIKLYGVT